eukprot:4571430-Prorocentrum_lima.AAC.1
MSGPKESVKEGWTLITTTQTEKTALVLDDPTGSDRYLGCKHCITTGTTTRQESFPSDGGAANHPRRDVRVTEYDME